MATVTPPSAALVQELRKKFNQKLENDGTKVQGGFHPDDLARVRNSDKWLERFLLQHIELEVAFTHLWDTCEWRKKHTINDIRLDNVSRECLDAGIFFRRNRAKNNAVLFVFKAKLHIRGNRDVEQVKRGLLYWVERLEREEKGEPITLIFDLANCGLSNLDMDLTKYLVNIFKYYYPFMITHILVYDLPWILNGPFKIIKALLPASAVEILKLVDSKSLKEYIDEDNMLKCWGGKDDYVYSFELEDIPQPKSALAPSIANKKVHFANLSPADSPMMETSNYGFDDKGDGEMLRINPQETIMFHKSENEYVGTVEIFNIDQKPITYKIKTTSPEKFRVRPSTGILSPNASASINVVLQQGHQMATLSRDKFLVMCMGLLDTQATIQDLAELWKNTPTNSSLVEQHRLKCTIPSSDLTGHEILKNGGLNGGYSQTDRGEVSNFQTTVSILSDKISRLEARSKFQNTLQWITLIVFILLSVAIVYILKNEIQTLNGHCPKRY